MTRFELPVLVVLSIPALVALADDPNKPASAEEQVAALKKDFRKANEAVNKAVQEAKDEKSRSKALEASRKVYNDYAARFFALADKNGKEDAAAEALLWILQRAPQSPEMPRAVKLLEKQHLQNPRLKTKLLTLESSPAPEVEHFLRVVLEKSTDKDTQGLACYTLALMLKNKAGDAKKKVRKEAEGLCRKPSEHPPPA